MSENEESVLKIQRKRCKNYSDSEKGNLIEILTDYKSIIENKQTDLVWAAEKKKAWENIATTYNCTATTGLRTGAKLKLLYDSMKKLAKKHKANDKVEIHRTGGGPLPVIQVTDNDRKIINMLGAQLEPHANSYDSNADFNTNNSTIIVNSDKTRELYAHEQDLAAVKGLSDQQSIICDIPSTNENENENKIDKVTASTSGIHNKSWKAKFTKNKNKTKTSMSSNQNHAVEIFKMKRDKHEMQMAILDIIKRKEQAELELKLLQLEEYKNK